MNALRIEIERQCDEVHVVAERSPLPNKQPSTRSAPASIPSSAAATPVPRSLCVCSDRTTCSRRSRWVDIHSI